MLRHWFHKMGGRTRHLVDNAADEMAEVGREGTRDLLAACPACRRELEEYRVVSATLRAWPRAMLTPEEAAAFWPGVERRMRQGATPAAHPARPTIRELFCDHPRLGLASATAAVLLVLGLTLGPRVGWEPGLAGSNGVEVVSVEAGQDASVMVFQAPGSSLKVIWVFEAPSS